MAKEAPEESTGQDEVTVYDETPSILTATHDRITDDALRAVKSFEDAINLAAAQHGDIEDYAEKYGTGFDVLEDKSILVKQDLLFMEWRFRDGDFVGGFVSVVGITAKGEKFVINDGGSGLFEDLKHITADTGRNGGLRIKKGLRESVYEICPSCGKPRGQMETTCSQCGDFSDQRNKGRTFYLDQSQN
jgi:hypothetical protein